MRADDIRVEPVHAALLLRRRRPELDADLARVGLALQLDQVAEAHVLQAVGDALAEVRHVR